MKIQPKKRQRLAFWLNLRGQFDSALRNKQREMELLNGKENSRPKQESKTVETREEIAK